LTLRGSGRIAFASCSFGLNLHRCGRVASFFSVFGPGLGKPAWVLPPGGGPKPGRPGKGGYWEPHRGAPHLRAIGGIVLPDAASRVSPSGRFRSRAWDPRRQTARGCTARLRLPVASEQMPAPGFPSTSPA